MTFLLKNYILLSELSLRSGDVNLLHRGFNRILGLIAQPESEMIPDDDKKKSKRAVLQAAIDKNAFSVKLMLLPNCEKFLISLQDYNPLLAVFGLRTRLGSESRMVLHRNKRINRYLIHMYHRMLQAKTTAQPLLYWKIALQLLIYSHSYMIAILHHSGRKGRNLYRLKSLKDFKNLLTKINEIRGNIASQSFRREFNRTSLTKGSLYSFVQRYIKYYRVYVPKGPDGARSAGWAPKNTYRPLGVPTLAWRVYCAMWLFPLTGACDIGDYQHGFVPHRGTLTCWSKMLGVVLKSRNLLEIDFKGFFPSISLRSCELALTSFGLPASIVSYITALNHSRPVLSKAFVDDYEGDFKLPEYSVLSVKQYSDHLKVLRRQKSILKSFNSKEYEKRISEHSSKLASLAQRFAQIKQWHPIKNDWVVTVLNSGQGVGNKVTPLQMLSRFFSEKELKETTVSLPSGKPLGLGHMHTAGLPQGASTSPFIAICYLDVVLKKVFTAYPKISYIGYADDGIFYSNDDLAFEDFLSAIGYDSTERRVKSSLGGTYIPNILGDEGLTLNSDKCVLTRSRGTNHVPSLKFLGLRYYLDQYKIITETRSGKRYKFPKELGILAMISRWLGKSRFSDLLDPNQTSSATAPHESMLSYFIRNLHPTQWVEVYKHRTALFRSSHILDKYIISNQKLLKGVSDYRQYLLRRYTDIIGTSANRNLTYLLVLRELYEALPKYLSEHVLPVLSSGRSKFLDGVYKGLILSRVYTGSLILKSFETPSGAQSFNMKYKTGSLGHVLHTLLGSQLTVANGSSYATHELVLLSRSLVRKGRYQLLSKGPITRNLSVLLTSEVADDGPCNAKLNRALRSLYPSYLAAK